MQTASKAPERRALLKIGLAPLLPQIIGSAFNIAYNIFVINPLLEQADLQRRFVSTVVFYNLVIYPLAVGLWLWVVYSLREPLHQLRAGAPIPAAALDRARRRVVHLPWIGAMISGASWLLCIPVFLGSLAAVRGGLNHLLLWHLPLSFLVSAFISITQSFFLIELASHRGLFSIFFQGVRPDRLAGIYPLSIRGRGIMWAVSAGICPIGSLLLLAFAPKQSAVDPQWFELVVGSVGIVFGLYSALLISQLVAKPIDQLRAAALSVSEGDFDVSVPLLRADEFGALIGEFNRMVSELREKERLRKTFGLHVGPKAAEQILARDPGLSGREQVITVMFVDIRSFTARAAESEASSVVAVLNEFLGIMVRAVEEHHSGMVNKFLGDGFMALFGAGATTETHADEALHAARELQLQLEMLNIRLQERGDAPLAIGIGLHTGPAIIGSIGSPERLEFTAIGNTVNVASRIEALTKTLEARLLLSDATRAALGGAVELREFPPQMVKGVAAPIRVWTPVAAAGVEAGAVAPR